MSEPKVPMDLYEVFTKPVAEMSDEELMEAMNTIRDQRKLKIVATKQKSGLDILIGKLTMENARLILEQLKAQEVQEIKAEEKK